MEAPVIEIADRDYAIWYRDMGEDMDKYDGKTVRFKGITGRSGALDDGFVIGRQIMTCCVADIRMCGLACLWAEKQPQSGSWVWVTAEIMIMKHKVYGGKVGPVLKVCARKKEGLEELREAMAGSLCCMTGQSGAGKSTLLNALMGLDLETGDISRKISRGKNTTRQAELIEKDGLRVMDTAGFNLLEAERQLEPEKLKERYPEFREYEGKCRFRECLHDREPGCAVREAAEAGILSKERVERYRILLGEIREVWRARYD